MIVYKKLNEIIKIGEDRIKLFHRVRNEVNSYRCIISAILNKKVYQRCVDELEATHKELNDFRFRLGGFHTKNKTSFTGIMAQYIGSYVEYINSVVNASEHRLILQKLIRDIKVNKRMMHYKNEVPNMIKDTDKSFEDCLLKAVAFNKIADKVKSAHAEKKRYII